MVVYGKRNKKYVLSTKPVRGDDEGAIYPVSGQRDLLVKVYQRSMRTLATEQRVIDTINGVGSMLGEYPIDIVYERGKFVGYTLEANNEYSEPRASTEHIESPRKPVRKGERLNAGIVWLISILVAGLLSCIIYYLIFPKLAFGIESQFVMYYFNGIPMIIGGWILLLLIKFKVPNMGVSSVFLDIVAFCIGSGTLFGMNWLIITGINLVISVIWLLLPMLIGIAVVAVLLKAIISKS